LIPFESTFRATEWRDAASTAKGDPMLDPEQTTAAADRLLAAERDCAPIEPLVESFPGIDVEDAYRIQLLNIGRRVATDGEVIGHKVGLSSKAMQEMMGVDEPDYGHLLAGMRLSPDVSGATGPVLPAAGRAGDRVHPGRGPAGGGLHGGGRAGRDRSRHARPRADRQPDRGLANPAAGHDRRQRLLGRVRARPERVDPHDLDLTAIPVRLSRTASVVEAGARTPCSAIR
jgi:2-keto-4-pentenoate hydratase